MTKEEYLKLVQGSEVFKGFAPEMQKKVLAAEGEKMEKYAVIFLKAREVLSGAKEDLMEKNAEIMKKLTGEIKNIQKEKLKTDETKASREDEKNEADLLNKLNTL